MERIAGYNEEYVTLTEAEEDFKSALDLAVLSVGARVRIIKAMCAIGKTKAILELLKNTSLKVLIALPNPGLKSEVCARAASMGIEITESPSLREIKDELPSEVWEHINELYKSGISPTPYIKKLIAQKCPDCAEILANYLQKRDEFDNCTTHAITTHKKLENMDVSKFDLVIIDEDIIFSSLFRNKISISISDLKKLRRWLKKNAPQSAIAKKITGVLIKIKMGEELFSLNKVTSEDLEIIDIEQDGTPTGIDVPSFCSATKFIYRSIANSADEDDTEADDDLKVSCSNNLKVKDDGDFKANTTINDDDCITFLKPVNFLTNIKNTKVIMLSATADETICRYYFGDDIDFYNCKKAKYVGTLKQYPDKPMSRAYISKNPRAIKQIKAKSGFEYTITFRKFKQLLPHYNGMHIGNTEGRDELKGQNIDIIGTPHQPEWIYKLCAYSIGLDFDHEARLQPGVTLTHNGYRFRMMSYADDKVLRAIQFYFINSEQEQVIGRARLLRTDAVVHLHSVFPAEQAVMGVFDWGDVGG